MLNLDKNLKAQLTSFLNAPTQQKAKDLWGSEAVNDGFFVCKSCGKKVPISETIFFDTPVIKGVRADLCKECWEEAHKEGACYLICMRCKELRKCMTPLRNPKTGFEMKSGQFYHLMDCPVCAIDKYKDKVVPAIIVEEAIYNGKTKQFNRK